MGIPSGSYPGTRGFEAEFLQLFAVPVCKFFWPNSDALNQDLKRVILRTLADSPGVVVTNRGGWQSKHDLQTWPDQCVKIFIERAQAAVQELVRRTISNPTEDHLNNWEIIAWANVNARGAFNTPHHHSGFGVIWSSFYYVDPGSFESGQILSGFTKFQDRSGIPKEILRNPSPFEREVAVTPEAGLMVVFPSTLYHYVEPYEGDRERITIAFNARHPGFTIPIYEGMGEKGWWWENFRGLMILPHKLPEKLYALSLLPSKLLTRSLPHTLHPRPWLDHFTSAIDQATAEASAYTQKKRDRSVSQRIR